MLPITNVAPIIKPGNSDEKPNALLIILLTKTNGNPIVKTPTNAKPPSPPSSYEVDFSQVVEIASEIRASIQRKRNGRKYLSKARIIFPNVRDHRWLPVARLLPGEERTQAGGVTRVAIRWIALLAFFDLKENKLWITFVIGIAANNNSLAAVGCDSHFCVVRTWSSNTDIAIKLNHSLDFLFLGNRHLSDPAIGEGYFRF
jgi:hypothetical protein